jgi:aminopeptidase N
MSTYLLAFAYGDLDFSEAKTKDGVVVRAYATPDNVRLTNHGLGVAVRALEFFSDYFGVAYPLPKLDMLALPDFSSGAMENWGLVTYRETTMLADDDSSSIESKQLVALVICHELSHQWFGNLVTMRWWDDLWLNESFANLMEYRAVDALYPEWHIWEQFVNTETASAKRRDSLLDVQPIHTDVHHPDEISTLFDPSIVYAKGGSVLRMLMSYIGEDNFRTGLKAYFEAHSYKNTEAHDLWLALSSVTHQDISAFMADWLNLPGYPLVRVGWQPAAKTVSLEQKRFVTDASYDDKGVLSGWQVPLASTVELSSNVLANGESSLEVKNPEAGPLIFNHDGQSYFIPKYDNTEHVQSILLAIKAGSVDVIDRLLLLDNYTMLQRGGVATTTELLDLLPAYEHETEESVWSSLAIALGEVRRLIEGDKVQEARLHTFTAKLVLATVERLGWDDQTDDSAQTLRLRGLIVSLAAGARVDSVLKEGNRRFDSFKKPGDLSPTIRQIVYYVGVRYGADTKANYKKLLQLHNKTTSADERDELASALTSAKQKEQYDQSLALLTTKQIRRQDLLHWYVWLLRNQYSREAAWDWLVSHWDWIENEFRSDKSYSFFARYAGSVFSTPADLEKFQSLFEAKKTDIALHRDISLGEQEIMSRVAWRSRNEAAVRQWLAANS